MSDSSRIDRNRIFGIGLAAVLTAAGTIQLARGSPFFPVFYGAAAAALAAALAAPRLLRPLARAFEAFGKAVALGLGWLLLAVLYFAVMTPLAVAGRIAGKRFLTLDIDRGAASYWISRAKGIDRDDYPRQW